MGDFVVGAVVVLTLATGIAQLVAFFVPPYGWALVRRLVTLGVWALLVVIALIGLIAFNYCEHNCPKDLNWPTAGIALGVLLLDALVLWLCWLDVRSTKEKLMQVKQ